MLTEGYTGARFGELAALQPRDVDLGRRRVTITRSLAEVRGIITETEPKAAASKRSVTLPQAVVDDLAAHLDQPRNRHQPLRCNGCWSVDLTGHYLNSILERRTVELQETTAELEALCVAQYE
jgi:integrase